jgi:hypothetical protein
MYYNRILYAHKNTIQMVVHPSFIVHTHNMHRMMYDDKETIFYDCKDQGAWYQLEKAPDPEYRGENNTCLYYDYISSMTSHSVFVGLIIGDNCWPNCNSNLTVFIYDIGDAVRLECLNIPDFYVTITKSMLCSLYHSTLLGSFTIEGNERYRARFPGNRKHTFYIVKCLNHLLVRAYEVTVDEPREDFYILIPNSMIY